MKKTLDFFKNNKHLITWTIFYTLAVWFILYFMFGFNIFNPTHWTYISHARMFGFVGFVFGALILSILPVYIATSIIIFRKKKPLFTIPLPKIFNQKKQDTAPVVSEKPEPKPEPTEDLSPDIPLEMHPAFIHAKTHPLSITIETPQTSSQSDDINDSALPLPTDFDISIDTNDNTSDTTDDAPVFQDLYFNTDDTDSTDNNSYIINYLNEKNIKFEIKDNIIITDTIAIISHNDSDFWVTDNDNWFATGKTKASPAIAVKSVAEKHNVKPVLYLAETNIMDIETLIPQWESDGITVITSLTEL